MANANRPNGLKPVRHLDGSAWNGAVNRYAILAADPTATFIGDPVKSGGTGDANGIPSVVQAAAGDTLRGVVVGFDPDPADLNSTGMYRKASTLRYCYVCDDPTVIFEIQEDSLGAATALVDIGENADMVIGTGSTTTGQSATVLDSSDHKTTTAQLRILRAVQREDNAVGQYCKWEVMINEHELRSTAGL